MAASATVAAIAAARRSPPRARMRGTAGKEVSAKGGLTRRSSPLKRVAWRDIRRAASFILGQHDARGNCCLAPMGEQTGGGLTHKAQRFARLSVSAQTSQSG